MWHKMHKVSDNYLATFSVLMESELLKEAKNISNLLTFYQSRICIIFAQTAFNIKIFKKNQL
jgi:hypothetical protein